MRTSGACRWPRLLFTCSVMAGVSGWPTPGLAWDPQNLPGPRLQAMKLVDEEVWQIDELPRQTNNRVLHHHPCRRNILYIACIFVIGSKNMNVHSRPLLRAHVRTGDRGSFARRVAVWTEPSRRHRHHKSAKSRFIHSPLVKELLFFSIRSHSPHFAS